MRRVIEAQLTASNFQLELYVDGYEFPEFDTGRDANTLACEIELDLRRSLDLHAAHSHLILDTHELASFVDQLRALEHAQDGEATLGNPDEDSGDQFGLTIRLKDGNGTLASYLTDSTTPPELRADRHRPRIRLRRARAVRRDRRGLPGSRRHHRRLSCRPPPTRTRVASRDAINPPDRALDPRRPRWGISMIGSGDFS